MRDILAYFASFHTVKGGSYGAGCTLLSYRLQTGCSYGTEANDYPIVYKQAPHGTEANYSTGSSWNAPKERHPNDCIILKPVILRSSKTLFPLKHTEGISCLLNINE